jgi:hypothetical protein
VHNKTQNLCLGIILFSKKQRIKAKGLHEKEEAGNTLGFYGLGF